MLQGKIALITGGSKGIGEALARAFVAEGARVAICARGQRRLSAVTEAIRHAGGVCEAVPADISDEDQVAALVQTVESRLGPIDILVNNAAYMLLRAIRDTSLDEWERSQAVNMRGPFLCCRAVLPSMMARKSGRIINIGSMAGKRGYAQQGAYCASKHGLVGLTKVLAIETQEYGIRVNMVSPGGVMTDLSEPLRRSRGAVKESEWMTPEEVAKAVIYICTQEGAAATDELVLRRYASEPWR